MTKKVYIVYTDFHCIHTVCNRKSKARKESAKIGGYIKEV